MFPPLVSTASELADVHRGAVPQPGVVVSTILTLALLAATTLLALIFISPLNAGIRMPKPLGELASVTSLLTSPGSRLR